MPGQFQDGNEVVTDAIVRLEAMGSDVVIVRRQGTAVRRLAFHGSNGKTRYFTVQCSQMYASGESLLPFLPVCRLAPISCWFRTGGVLVRAPSPLPERGCHCQGVGHTQSDTSPATWNKWYHLLRCVDRHIWRFEWLMLLKE